MLNSRGTLERKSFENHRTDGILCLEMAELVTLIWRFADCAHAMHESHKSKYSSPSRSRPKHQNNRLLYKTRDNLNGVDNNTMDFVMKLPKKSSQDDTIWFCEEPNDITDREVTRYEAEAYPISQGSLELQERFP
ncbi:hypothetical protein Tco_0393250 [Tanacetum coccineum]